MKIAGRSGHTVKSGGAAAILNETVEAKKVWKATKKYLEILGQQVVDVTPSDATAYPQEINHGINQANKVNADLFVSIHFNKAYSNYKGALGSEVCVKRNIVEAERVLNKLEKVIGFKNRGQKIRNNLAELNNTTMKAMIIEVCFVEATKDAELYNKHGADWIGRQIAEGIVGRDVPAGTTSDSVPNDNKPVENKPVEKPVTSNKKLWELSITGEVVKQLQRAVGVKADGYFGDDTLKACPLLRTSNYYSDIVKAMQTRLAEFYNLKVDGYFGTTTLKYVKEFQRSRGLDADGIIGVNTWKALYRK